MEEPTCTEGDCDAPASARNLCQAHYFRRRRSGTLPEDWVRTRRGGTRTHALSSVDAQNRIADCSLCGPGVRIRLRTRRGEAGGTRPECAGYYRNSKSAVAKESNRRYLLWNKYGMTIAEYQIRYEAQGRKCLICRRSLETLVVDHCHETGKVRGLLCPQCNVALGLFSDDQATIERAAVYLKRWAA